jgi:hypothetical protein
MDSIPPDTSPTPVQSQLESQVRVTSPLSDSNGVSSSSSQEAPLARRMTLWPTNLWLWLWLSVTSVTLCFVSSPTSSPHGVPPGTSKLLAVGCGLNNFARGRAYSCLKASMGFIFAARIAG